MVIGVIGAGLSGLIAGKTLAEAGHEVLVFDKSNAYGGRLSCHTSGEDSDIKLDNGVSFLQGDSEEFKRFISELENKGLLQKWCEYLSFSDGNTLSLRYPGKEKSTYYMAPKGMDSIGKYLGRWLDFRFNVTVSSLTFIGSNRLSKKNWMITMSDINTYELDAIIVALPAVQANGLVQTSQDERAFRKIIQRIGQVEYDACYSLSAGYGKRESPEWNGIICQDDRIKWMSNESSKRQNKGELGLVIQSTGDFANKYKNADSRQVTRHLLEKASVIAGSWAGKPDWYDLQLWNYDKPRNPLDMPFIELEDHPAPAALVGDYFGNQTMESAYLSGLRLGNHWVEKYKQ